MELTTLTELLNIPGYKVTRIIQSTPARLHLLVEAINPGPPICSGCGLPHNQSIHSIGKITIQDLSLCCRLVFLQVTKRKVKCDQDRRIRVETLDWIVGHFTKRFAEEILRLTTVTSYRAAGWYLGLDDETIHRTERRKKAGTRHKEMEQSIMNADINPRKGRRV